MASREQTTDIPVPSAPPDYPFEGSDNTKMLQNILQSLNLLTSKLDSVSDRLRKVERKVEVMGGAPPPYTSAAERGSVLSRNDETMLNEIRQVHESVIANGYFRNHHKIIIYGLSHTVGENTTEVVKVFLRKVLDMTEGEIEKYIAFACRLPPVMAVDGHGPPPVEIVTYGIESTAFKILKKLEKKDQVLKRMNITTGSKFY